MNRRSIPELIRDLEACTSPDWALDDEINNTTGVVKVVAVLRLNGRGRETRYFGPNSDPYGRGSAVPKPTKSLMAKRRALRLLRAMERIRRGGAVD